MPALVNVPESARGMHLRHGFEDDFYNYVTGDLWTLTASNSGTAAIADGVKGVLTLSPSDGTVADNDESYLHQTEETFKFVAGKPLEWEAYIQFTEANTDDANHMVGLKDAWAADSLQDDGAGPAASFSGMGFYKVDGGTNWNIVVSIGSTQTLVELTAANSLDGVAKTAGGSSYQRLRGTFTPTGGGLGDFDFFIDDTHVYRVKDVTITSATDMEFGFGSKNGDTNHDQLNIDYAWCYQKR